MDCNLKREYRSKLDNVIQSFYIPLLKEATLYQRAVGFFSSSLLVEISKGIASMAKAGGKIQLIASPHLSDDDIIAIRKGYERRDVIIENALLRELSDEHYDYYSMERLNLLANLIADGVLDIKIAFVDGDNGIGMYHEKMGLISDVDGNIVAFSGSNNETSNAVHANYETVDVYRSWGDTSEKEMVQLKKNAFFSIWSNTEPHLKVLDFPNVTDALIAKYRRKEPDFELDTRQFAKPRPSRKKSPALSGRPVGARVPEGFNFYPYQQEAIDSWVGENYRGIFDMATGTGKTYTGLGAISRLSEDLDDDLAVIICCPYQHLVEQWVEDIEKFNINPIVAYSGSSQKDWKKRLANAVRDQKLRDEKRFFCLATTNATFSGEYVQEQINKIHSPILLVVDEAHNFGAPTYARTLDDRFTYRLALSATLDRHNDEEGTNLLYQFFGRKCIEYPLSRAIEEGKLTRYKYYPYVVTLTDDELMAYENLTYEIGKCVIKGRNGKVKLSKRGEILALKRSRLVAGAAEKLPALRKAITPYIHANNILVYCGATKVLAENADRSDVDSDDMRQIEAVTRMLGNELGMAVSKFTAEEDMETRAVIKKQFERGDRLQAIVAIKCLDEGVNIPGIRTAFILASTTNPKEYIQRRGRVLRKAKGKEFAEIYDFVTLPRPLDTVSGMTLEEAKHDRTLVKNELNRVKEFGRMSMNPMDAESLIWQIQDTYHITDDDESIEEEF